GRWRGGPGGCEGAVGWGRGGWAAGQRAGGGRWRYRDRGERWGGRGQGGSGPAGSLRFDYVGPLGLGAGAAVVVGDSAIWADPEKNFRSIVPAVRMLWAGLGMVRPPAPGAAISGLNTPPVTIWRFAQDADTLDYRVTDGAGGDRVLEAEWRQGGRVMARTRTQLDAHALPAGA